MRLISSYCNRGFSLTELLVSLAISSLVLLGGFRLFQSATQKGTESVREVRTEQEINKFLHRISNEITNAVPVYAFSGGGQATVMNVGTNAKPIQTGLLPIPWVALNDLSLHPIIDKPSSIVEASLLSWVTSGNLPAQHDAVRIAYFPEDSKPIPVETTIMPFTDQKVEVSLINQFSSGEFIRICNAYDCDLVRITSVQSTGSTDYLYYDANASIWNKASGIRYGSPDPGNPNFSAAQVQKIHIVTYAYDAARKAIFRDDHLLDDGFNPQTKSFGARGRVPNWQAVAEGVEKFQIHYLSHNFDCEATSSNNYQECRFPRAVLNNYSTEDCGKTSYPDLLMPCLKSLRILIQPLGTSKTISKVSTPINLKAVQEVRSSSGGTEIVDAGIPPVPGGPAGPPVGPPGPGSGGF